MLDKEKHVKRHGEDSQEELKRVPIDALPVVGHGAVHHQLQNRKEAACFGVDGWVEWWLGL